MTCNASANEMRNYGILGGAFALVIAILFGMAEGGLVSSSRQVIDIALATIGKDRDAINADLLQPVLKLSISAASTAAVIYILSFAVYRALQAVERENQESAAREIRKQAWSSVSMLEISEDSLPNYSRSLGFEPKDSQSSKWSFEAQRTRKALHSSPEIEAPFLGTNLS